MDRFIAPDFNSTSLPIWSTFPDLIVNVTAHFFGDVDCSVTVTTKSGARASMADWMPSLVELKSNLPES
ncbi:hypothetical protein, partial [Stieleria sp.]|uniref:hypothetical protein n=1 Tax=Stieleria sp. TaxID=2795976 RepID=UPI003568266A